MHAYKNDAQVYYYIVTQISMNKHKKVQPRYLLKTVAMIYLQLQRSPYDLWDGSLPSFAKWLQANYYPNGATISFLLLDLSKNV